MYLIYLPGRLVPRATKQIAVTESFIPKVQPNCVATSPMTVVTTPIHIIDTTKHKYPLNMSTTRKFALNVKLFSLLLLNKLQNNINLILILDGCIAGVGMPIKKKLILKRKTKFHGFDPSPWSLSRSFIQEKIADTTFMITINIFYRITLEEVLFSFLE